MPGKIGPALATYIKKKGKPMPEGSMNTDVAADSKNEWPNPAQKKAASSISKYFKGR